ncbi:hypothetical protein [Cellulomonas marina]|uniref:hypothetical protein n=1 Tax=Cellulomonas marina TaxID=988821 RepID=UPI003CC81FF3
MRALVVLVALGALGTGAVAAVLAFLDRGAPGLAAERCSTTLDGTDWHLTPEQADNAALVAGAAVARGLPARAATIALATTLQESGLVNVTYGDRDSLGLFQQRPSQGWGTAEQVQDRVHATGRFYDALVEVEGWADLPVTVAAQAVQRSAFPDAYAQHEVRSRAWASALTGWSPAVLTCDLHAVDGAAGTPAPTAADRAAALGARAAQDLGAAVSTGAAADGSPRVVLDLAARTPDDPSRGGWAAAQWAVATAWATGATSVETATARWERGTPGWATTTPTDAAAPAPGTAVVGFAATP